MSDIRFGFCVPTFALPGVGLFRTPGYAALDPVTTMALGRAAEELGYDSLWVADHLMLGQDDAILEGWTTLAALAGATQHVRLGMIHQANGFRHPALAAKMAATLDQISGGRLIHFIDGGTQRREHLAYSLPWSDDSAERIARRREGLELTLALWAADRPVSFAGAHYRVEAAVCAPRPLQKPHPPVWFGEAHPAILETCAHYGQGWNSTPVALPELRRRLAALVEACARIGGPYMELDKESGNPDFGRSRPRGAAPAPARHRHTGSGRPSCAPSAGNLSFYQSMGETTRGLGRLKEAARWLAQGPAEGRR
jgi:alkanesulfonate monooxygenase SsuD/methylene tetrahydromethanopterin reductase-like flavin-dependent oxidoreductase (luciferase family)